ncbi:MAG: ABC transporter ATP-binding protein [Deltaproteobacteria bacterium]|nr:ABC transporter ATP-binding protein [Deltaproteobacteria bacterium]
MLKGNQITKRFGGLIALSRVDFEVGQGEIVGLIGPNGSGKTTLFNVISGLHKPDAGTLHFKNKPISGLPPHKIAKRGIGRTFQIVRPLMDLDLYQNVAVAVLYGREGIHSPRLAERRAAEILDFTGLSDKAHKFPGQLALEDRKRLEIARALAARPHLILLDEVFAGLNQKEIEEAMDLTFRIRKEFDVTIFMIEHVMKAIMGTCSRVMVLHGGIKIADGTPDQVAGNQEVIKAYLGAAYADR